MPIHLDDRKLVKRLLAGDEQAFDRFFEDNFSRLYRFAMARLSGDSEVASEVAQAALSRALRKIQSYRGEAALFTLSLIHISEPTRLDARSRMPSSA